MLLGGVRGQLAVALAGAAGVTPLLLNPPRGLRDQLVNPSAIRIVDVIPIASGALRGAALDAATATPALLAGVARALRPGGRVVAPAWVPLPAGVRELARDAAEWVAEPDLAASAPIPLRRR